MEQRPGTRESRNSRPSSSPESLGVGTIAPSEGHFSPSIVAGDVAEDITSTMFDNVLSSPLHPGADLATAEARQRIDELIQENSTLKLQIEQKEAELGSARSARSETEDRNRKAEQQIDVIKDENAKLKSQIGQMQLDDRVASLEDELKAARQTIEAATRKTGELEAQLASSDGQIADLQQHLQEKNPEQGPERVRQLEEECAGLRKSLAQTQAAHNEARQLHAQTSSELAMLRSKDKELSLDKSTIEPDGEEKPLLAAAYQQISVLNTQLATLYTELTMSRTEVGELRRQATHTNQHNAQGGTSEAEVLKQSQQIADLVSDIRHLQLDLEYHQQKLDQMIEEKQQMMRDLKKSQGELEEARRQLEEKDQMLKHRDVDIKQLKEDTKSPRQQAGESEGGAALAALRAEAAAKDSALIVSHYELHKEKLLRDRLEQKNLKLMERMQKLMMVVETMRKENVTLERSLVAKEQTCDTKDQQLRQVTQKAKKLEKFAKATKAGQKGAKAPPLLELGSSSQQALPPLDRSQRSMDSGRRSGTSTPRTPRAPASPYGARKD